MSLDVLRHRPARRMLFAQANQGAAGWMQTTAGSWYVLTQAGSTTALSFFVVVSMIPSLLLNPVGGRLMDRHSPITMVKVLAPLAGIVPLLIAALFFTDRLSVPLILLLTVFGSAFRALQAPTFSKILPETVPEDERATVLGYSAIAFNLSRSVGPIIAGIAGTGLAYLIAGLGFFLVALIVFITPLPPSPKKLERAPDAEPTLTYRKAVVVSWGIATIRSLFLCIFVFYLVAGSIHQLLAAVAKNTSSTSTALGLLYASAAVGAMLVNPPILKYLGQGRSRSLLLIATILGAGITVIFFGFVTALPGDMALMVVLGALGEVMYLTAQRGILMELSEANSGAVFGLFLAALTAASILGSLGLGVLMDRIGVREGLLVVGIATVIIGLPILAYLSRQARNLRHSQPSSPAD